MTEPADIRHKGALHGTRVLDLSRVLAGPWASQLLADLGADVIKVERPAVGDDTRAWGPPWLSDANNAPTGESAYFLATNRNKRSMTLDLGHPQGQALARRLIRSSDVVLENFKVGTMEKFGLGVAGLLQENPALVVCSVSAYGQSGSRAEQPGYDAMIQASAGLMSITGEADEDGGSPQKVGVAISDIMAGMYATTAILAALVVSKTTGRGQHIDVPLYDTQVAWLANQSMNYLVSGVDPERLGTAHPNLVPYQVFPTADGYLMLAVGNDRQFRRCCECLEAAQLADDARFSSNARRVENRPALISLMRARFRTKKTSYWLDKFKETLVPAGPIKTIAEVFSDPYASERELLRTLPHSLAGQVPTVSNPLRFSATPVEYRNGPPLLGEHTQDILSVELGLSGDEIEALATSGVI